MREASLRTCDVGKKRGGNPLRGGGGKQKVAIPAMPLRTVSGWVGNDSKVPLVVQRVASTHAGRVGTWTLTNPIPAHPAPFTAMELGVHDPTIKARVRKALLTSFTLVNGAKIDFESDTEPLDYKSNDGRFVLVRGRLYRVYENQGSGFCLYYALSQLARRSVDGGPQLKLPSAGGLEYVDHYHTGGTTWINSVDGSAVDLVPNGTLG